MVYGEAKKERLSPQYRSPKLVPEQEQNKADQNWRKFRIIQFTAVHSASGSESIVIMADAAQVVQQA